HGHTIPYFDRTKVTTYIAVEPNELFHPVLRATAAKYGYNEASGSFILIPLGAENSSDILKSLGDHHIDNGVDTIISILTFCSIPSAETVITQFIGQLLRPGGILLFLEHVRSNRPDVRRWQTRWTPIWTLFFDGCRMDVPSDRLINDMDIWAEKEVWSRDDETDERLFWHRVGRYVRA
ncbi:uncharacterized protein EI90DRAFT_3255047, partial [Cantharellus anzutake]|uniref:uncharacterized protein n=1 Tax=Cantharellus anzutake TaxID=1750568 RepID=UPI0019068B69